MASQNHLSVVTVFLSSVLIISCGGGGGGGGGNNPPSPPPPNSTCATGDDCDFVVSLSNRVDQQANFSPTQEYSYAWGFNNAPSQLQDNDNTNLGFIWVSSDPDSKRFDYLQTSNVGDYEPLTNSPPTALYVKDIGNSSSAMRLQYGNQVLDATQNPDGFFYFDLTQITLETSSPYQFTVHPYDDNENRELAVWLSSTYRAGTPTSVLSLWDAGTRNKWIVGTIGGTTYLAYAGGLYQFALDNPGGFSLDLDMDLNGQAMNLSTNYALFEYLGGPDDADTCRTTFNCQVQLKGQYTLPVSGPIIISGSGRINGYEMLKTPYVGKYTDADFRPQALSALATKAEYRVQSGLIELSSSGSTTEGFAIDIAGITVGFSSQRQDSSVLLNNKNLAMASPEDVLTGNIKIDANNYPVKTFDFKMVGNWAGQSDGVEPQGAGSQLSYTYLHIADDSMKVAARDVRYTQTTVLQGDVSTGGVIHIGSYGTHRESTEGSVVDGVYVHRITHKNVEDDTRPGYKGAALVAAQTCEFGNNVEGVKVTNLRVNDLGNGISSVNKPFNLGLGASFGFDDCGLTTKTFVRNLSFEDFQIYLNPLAKSTIFNRGADGGTISNINFFDGNVTTQTAGKVAIFNLETDSSFAYFICGVDTADQSGCWNTLGENGNGVYPTASNITYAGPDITDINFPFGP